MSDKYNEAIEGELHHGEKYKENNSEQNKDLFVVAAILTNKLGLIEQKLSSIEEKMNALEGLTMENNEILDILDMKVYDLMEDMCIDGYCDDLDDDEDEIIEPLDIECDDGEYDIEFKATGDYYDTEYMGLVSRKKNIYTGTIQDVYRPFKSRKEYKKWYYEERIQ